MIKKSTDELLILDYLEKLRIRPSKNSDDFWGKIKSKYGFKIFETLNDIIQKRADSGRNALSSGTI